MNQDGQGHEMLQGPTTRARRIKGKDDQIAHGLMIAIEETMKKVLKFKNKGLEDDENPPKLLMVQYLNLEQPMKQIGKERIEEEARTEPTTEQGLLRKRLIRFDNVTDGHLPTPSHHEGISDPTMMNLNETSQTMQQFIDSLSSQFQGIVRDVKS
ncbi:hypothetical protein M9H77_23419 [Catharanthus roseus]|uniref:Uncharacterized protein n=1 Tax=Catharanthus roseus TaxID=4058 RepID=A0ACC0AXB0_CATRO|nr:hypothetical protein M9H77_23419 [Catharanthus roseus]